MKSKCSCIKGMDFVGVCVVTLCHDGKGNFVMMKRSKNCRDEHGMWDIGGGGLKFGETVEHALRREIKEEYCTNVLGYDFLGYDDVHRMHQGRKTHWIALRFKVLIDRGKVQNGEPDMMDELGWFTLDSLPSPLHSQLGVFFEKYKDQLQDTKK